MLQSRLIAKRPFFSSVDEHIAHIILTMPFNPDMTSTSLAKECEVSQSTIVRFAQKLGYVSFREFLSDYVTFKYEQPSMQDNSLPTKSSQRMKEVFDYLDAHSQNPTFQKGLEALSNATSISLVIDEQSDLLGSLFETVFSSYLIPIHRLTPQSSLTPLLDLKSSDVVLFIQLKESKWMLEAMLCSKHALASCILITPLVESSLKGYANHVMPLMPISNQELINIDHFHGCTYICSQWIDNMHKNHSEHVEHIKTLNQRSKAISALAQHKHHES
jgi:DNA-binding MurR/RpiR family transcriptional regulator